MWSGFSEKWPCPRTSVWIQLSQIRYQYQNAVIWIIIEVKKHEQHCKAVVEFNSESTAQNWLRCVTMRNEFAANSRCHCQGSHSDWKTWKNGKAFSSQGKVREFWTDWKSQGKVRENHTKYWKTQGIWNKYYLIFLMIFKWTVYYLLKWIKFSV